jgi:hypothetical protein
MGRPSRYRLNAISQHRERARKAGREKLKRQPIPEAKAPRPVQRTMSDLNKQDDCSGSLQD